MSNLTALKNPASPTAAPLIAGAAALATTTATAFSLGLPPELTIVGAAMLADLMKSIPAQRAADKADETLRRLRQDMDDLHVRMDQWSDQQYQFVKSMMENIMSTGDADKLEYLKRAALNVALNGSVVEVGGAFLARIIRDITAPEIAYLVANFGSQPLLPEHGLDEANRSSLALLAKDQAMVFVETENDEEVVTGLQTLGLLRNAAARSSAQDLMWTKSAGKVLALVREPMPATPA